MVIWELFWIVRWSQFLTVVFFFVHLLSVGPIILLLSVCLPVCSQLLSETTSLVFVIFCMMLGVNNCQKLMELDFLENSYFIFCFLAQMPYLPKFQFLSYCPKYSCPVRLPDTSNCDVSREGWVIFMIFYI